MYHEVYGTEKDKITKAEASEQRFQGENMAFHLV